MKRRNPATPRTAARLLRATREVERARRAVNRKAGAKRPARAKDKRAQFVRSVARKSGMPEEFVAEVVQPDLSLKRPARMPDDIWGPIARATGTEKRRRPKQRGRSAPQDWLEELAQAEEAREFRAKMRSATGRYREHIDNPPRAVREGLALFKRWSGREARAVSRVKVPEGLPRVLVNLGHLTDIGYSSDKWGGKRQRYIHATGRPRPILAASPDGRQLFILGGGVRVRAEGLVG